MDPRDPRSARLQAVAELRRIQQEALHEATRVRQRTDSDGLRAVTPEEIEAFRAAQAGKSPRS